MEIAKFSLPKGQKRFDSNKGSSFDLAGLETYVNSIGPYDVQES